MQWFYSKKRIFVTTTLQLQLWSLLATIIRIYMCCAKVDLPYKLVFLKNTIFIIYAVKNELEYNVIKSWRHYYIKNQQANWKLL
jgi:hypothetical protein